MAKPLLLFLIAFLFHYCCVAQQPLSRPYTPGFTKGKISTFIKDIREKTGVEVSYSEATIHPRKTVRLKGPEHTIEEVLRTILQEFAVTLKASGNKILIVPIEEHATQPAMTSMTLSGFIKDSASKEVLLGASVYIPATTAGVAANLFGFYSLTVPAGQHKAIVSYVGYKPKVVLFSPGHTQQDILLSQDLDIEEISVTDKAPPPSDHSQFKPSDITYYTSLLGDNDILKALQHLPGVQSAADGTTNLIVRGGDPGQNLNLLDGVPLYYTDHFYGISSIYNTDALKTVDFYSGAFPARYGGRLSSIIDVNTKDGDMERWGGVAKVGLLNGSLNLNGPIVKDKASAVITARRSWMDLIWRPFDNTVGVNFYDINAKINYIINPDNRIFLSVYNGQDRFRVRDDETDFSAFWGNTFAALKWNSVLSPKVFLNSSATYSTYRFRLNDGFYIPLPDSAHSMGLAKYKGVTSVHEKTLRSQLYYYAGSNHKIEAGFKYANSFFDPADVTFADGTSGQPNYAAPADGFYSNEALLYAEDEWKVSEQLKIRAGLHWANWFSEDFNYSSLQPRLFFNYKPAQQISIYASFTRMAQFLHMLSNNTSGFPTDFWLPSTAAIKPETSWLGNAGIQVTQPAKGLNYGVGLYYKHQQNLITYRGNKNIFEDPSQWEDRLTQGKGWSYGAELMLRKESERMTATLAYTLSWSYRRFDQINYGEVFPYRFDRRHNLHIDGLYQLGKKINITAGWTYMSGEAITLPDQAYPDFDNNILNNYSNYGYTFNHTSWNSYRLPAIHRLDLAISFTRKKKERYERTITLGIYNAYGRRNLVGTALTQDDNGAFQLEGYSIGRFIPTISYRLQF
jgi:outer membrane receptor for ferrienterochelin and colicin